MSDEQNEPTVNEPQVGQSFYTVDEDDPDGEADERHEIDEVFEHNTDDESWNVGSGGDFFDIKWNAEAKRWEEDL